MRQGPVHFCHRIRLPAGTKAADPRPSPPQETDMADNKAQTGGQDRARINLGEDYEVRDWSRKFGVSPEELKRAVEAVGNDAAAVEAHLKGGKR
jgi:hypothetical protein